MNKVGYRIAIRFNIEESPRFLKFIDYFKKWEYAPDATIFETISEAREVLLLAQSRLHHEGSHGWLTTHRHRLGSKATRDCRRK